MLVPAGRTARVTRQQYCAESVESRLVEWFHGIRGFRRDFHGIRGAEAACARARLGTRAWVRAQVRTHARGSLLLLTIVNANVRIAPGMRRSAYALSGDLAHTRDRARRVRPRHDGPHSAAYAPPALARARVQRVKCPRRCILKIDDLSEVRLLLVRASTGKKSYPQVIPQDCGQLFLTGWRASGKVLTGWGIVLRQVGDALLPTTRV